MKLIIPKEVEERIHGYVMSVNSEIAGMGRVRVEGEDIIVEEVMIYEQTATGATADLSQEAIAKWLTDLVRAGGSPKDWKLWFHSHHTMPAFFSGRDTATIDGQTESDWLVSLVVNCKREREARLDTYRPFRLSATDLEIEVEGAEAFSVPADIAEEVARKVKTPAPTIGYTYGKYPPTPTTGLYDLSDEEEYTAPELKALTETIQAQIADLENRGMGASAEANELTSELIDAYYEMASIETSAKARAEYAKRADQLETVAYGLTYPYEL